MVASNRFVFGRWLDLFRYLLWRHWSQNYLIVCLISNAGSNGSLTIDGTWWAMWLACGPVVWARAGCFRSSTATSCGASCTSCWMNRGFCHPTGYGPFRNTTAIIHTFWMSMALLTASTTNQGSRVRECSEGIRIG